MDLTIRLLGRPKVSKDTTQGFQTMARKYVVAGNRASARSLNEIENPLFLPLGTPDVEFEDHLLVDQRLEPSDSMERAYLSRTFLKMRERWVQESVSENADLIKITRTFVAIRGAVSIYGYSPSAWAKHPSNEAAGVAKDTSEDPWDYAPEPVLKGAPGQLSYTNAEAAESGFSEDPWVSIGGSSDSLANYLMTNANSDSLGTWMRGSAQVTMAAPGVDVWSVSWVTHASPYWTFGTTSKGGGSKNGSFTIVDFNHLGLKLTNVDVAGGGGGSTPLKAKTFNTFHVGEELPEHLAEIAGGTTVGSSSTPSVNLDFHIKIWQGRTISFKQYLRNAVWQMNTTEHLTFPTLDGQQIDVGEKDPYIMKFENTPFIWDDAGQTYMDTDGKGLPLYQGSELAHIGGQITWSGTQKNLNAAGQTVLNSVGTKIAPIFRKGKDRIWKVQITYVG